MPSYEKKHASESSEMSWGSVHFRVCLLEMLTARTVFTFCLVLESYKHQDRMFVCVSGSAENSTGFARFGN